MSDHAKLSPSSAHRWFECPGSIAFIGDASSEDTIYSAEGTFLHEISARMLREDIDRAAQLIGAKGKVGKFEFTLDQKHADAVQEYVDIVREVAVFGHPPLIELPVRITQDVYGTLDAAVWAINRQSVDVFDAKFGAGTYVPARGNKQLLIYTLGALNQAGIPPHLLDEARLHISQPRYTASDERHRIWAVTGEELREFSKQLHAAAAATESPTAPLIAGEHCKFCPKKSVCPALQAQSLQTAVDLFPDLTLQAAPRRVEAFDKIQQLTGDELALLLPKLSIVEEWVAAVREAAHNRMLRGEKVPGYKLVEKKSNRAWINEAEAAAFLQSRGVDPFEPRSVISPAAAERADKSLKPAISKLVERHVTGVKVALESDSAPAVGASVLADFPLIAPQIEN